MTNIGQISDKYLTNSGQISYKYQTITWQISYEYLTNIWCEKSVEIVCRVLSVRTLGARVGYLKLMSTFPWIQSPRSHLQSPSCQTVVDSFSFHATKPNQPGPRRQIQVGTAAADQARRLPTAVGCSTVLDKCWTSLHDPVVSDHLAGHNTAGGSLHVLLSNPHLSCPPSHLYSLTFSGVFKCW